MKIDIKNYSMKALGLWLESEGIRAYRAVQIFNWIYRKQVDGFAAMSDLSKELRQLLEAHFSNDRLQIETTAASQDGSVKYLFRLADGHTIESVLMPEKDHSTLCISSQVGCAQGCAFCLTGAGGFVRNLTLAEILSQVRDIQWQMDREAPRLSNIVMMGMGEPLANYAAVVQAIEVLTNARCGLGFSTRKVTLSTVGLAPRILQLGQDVMVNLAVSLNAADDEIRNRLMPINRTFPLDVLMSACRGYALPKRRRITFEYILMEGVNDAVSDALKLVKLLHGIRAKVNLIPYNEHEKSVFRRPSVAVIERFQAVLMDKGMTAIIRNSKGQDIGAACGQLRADRDLAG
jgi:23S rRNA (adenine2503-C2)-methyltransferase